MTCEPQTSADSLILPTPAGAVAGDEFATAGIRDTAPASQPIRDASRWSVGTLTYSTASLLALFGLLLAGDFALSMRDRSVGPVVQLMLKRMGTSDTAMALLFATLPPGLSLLIGPIVSCRSDRYRGRWGRRIPFLLAPTPVAAMAMIALGFSEDFGRALNGLLAAYSPGIHLCTLACFSLAWTVFECAVVTASAVMGGLINDVVPRAVIGRFYGMFRAVSLMAGMVFNFTLMGSAETHFRAIFVSIAFLFLLGFGVMCLNVREGDYPPPADDHKGVGGLYPVRTYFKECFCDGYYRWIFAGMTLAATSFIPINLFGLQYARQIQLSPHDYGALIGWTYTVSLVLAWPMGWLVDRLNVVRVAVATMGLYSIAMLLSGLMLRDASALGPALIVHGVLSGCYLTASASLGQTLFPRLQFGQFASAAVLVQSLFTMVLSPSVPPRAAIWNLSVIL